MSNPNNLRPVFVSTRFFGKGDRKTEPKKPFTGPFFERPAGVRQPASEERERLGQGILESWR